MNRVTTVDQAVALAVGDAVTVEGVNGNGELLTLTGYVAVPAVDTGRRGMRIMLAPEPGGRTRPVYVREAGSGTP